MSNGNATEESYKKLNELEMSSPLPDGGPSMISEDSNSGGSIGSLAGGHADDGRPGD